MGLDNGICVKVNSRKKLWPMFKYPFSTDYGDSVELCYWRKCWNIRNNILSVLGQRFHSDEDYHFTLTRKDIKDIIDILKFYLDEPDEWDNSIWTFDEIKSNLKNSIHNLRILLIWKIFHPKVEVYFYDSY